MPTDPLHAPLVLLSRATTAAPTAERSDLIAPHGGELVSLMLEPGQREAAIKSCNRTVELSDRNACDVELLIVG